jgi:hypothetical protein
MIWQSSEEMAKTPVKPTVKKNIGASVLWLLSMYILVPEEFSSKVFSTGCTDGASVQ